jgi:hypothetical protein
MILTTNPLKARRGWIKEKFKLHQLNPEYKGEVEPIVPPCDCHMCPACKKTKNGDWLFVDPQTKEPSTKKGAICSNSECSVVKAIGVPQVKDNDCPGNQVYFRVIELSSADNPHKPSDYESSAGAGMSEETRNAMIDGQAYESKNGEVYQAFCDENILVNSVPIDLTKDLVWSLDFNYDPQCSVICQEFNEGNSFYINVIDEIVKWNALPEHAAKEFCKRYHFFKETDNYIDVYSDPAGLWGGGKDLKPTYYKTIIDYLRAPTNELGEIAEGYGKPGFVCPDGYKPFKVRVKMQLDKRSYKDKNRIKVKVPLADSIQALNHLLKNEINESKIFINPKCKYLICSLENVKWDGTGQDIDKSIDKKAARKRSGIHPMTHPSDALRYYVYKRFPLIKNKKGVMLIQSPGRTSSVYREGKIEDIDRREMIEELIKQKEVKKQEKLKIKEQKRIERRKRLERKSTNSLLGNLFGKSRGPFGGFSNWFK